MGGITTAEELPDPLHRQPDGSRWPVPPPNGYTIDDFFALDLPPHTELIDGSLVFVSPQRSFHSLAMCLLEQGMRQHIPGHLRVRRQMVVVLGPGNAPEPDLTVIRAEGDGGPDQNHYRSGDVVLAVEVVSPDSEDRDRTTKPQKYAAAGIPYFWLVEKTENGMRPKICTYEIDRVGRAYALTGIHHDRLKTTAPYDVDIDLTAVDHL